MDALKSQKNVGLQNWHIVYSKTYKEKCKKKFFEDDKEPVENSTAPVSVNKEILHTSFTIVRNLNTFY